MMKYEELIQSDLEGAYSDFLSVEKAKTEGIIPKKYENIFPNECECGSDFIISKNLKTIKCADPFCPIKVANRMANMFSNFGSKGLAVGNCMRIVNICKQLNLFQVPTHTEILRVYNDSNLRSILGESAWLKLYSVCETIVNSSFTLDELIGKIAIPEFKSNSAVFKDVYTLDELIGLFKSNKIRLYLSSKGVYSSMKINQLRTHLYTIIFAVISLKKPLITLVNRGFDSEKIICITGSVSADGQRFRNREMFPAYLNREVCNVDGMQIFTVRNTKARESCDFIIADSPSNNESYIVGKRRGNLMTAQEYTDYLRKEVELWIEKKLEESSQ